MRRITKALKREVRAAPLPAHLKVRDVLRTFACTNNKKDRKTFKLSCGSSSAKRIVNRIVACKTHPLKCDEYEATLGLWVAAFASVFGGEQAFGFVEKTRSSKHGNINGWHWKGVEWTRTTPESD